MNRQLSNRRISFFVAPIVAIVIAAAPAVSSASVSLQEPASDASKPADNSAQNKNQGVTADQQSNKSNDRQIARKIRQSIVGDKSLSTYAHNVKVIVKSGAVTLKGPVRSEDEKTKVADLAAQVVGGSDKVTNELTVQP